jgi:preprotein translocase subunit SecD
LNKQFIYLGIVVLLAALAGYLFATQPIRRGLDVQGGLRMTLRAEIEKLSPEERKLWTPERMRLVIDILSRRIDSLGVLEPTIYQKGDTEIVIELPGFTDEQEARDLLQTTARLEFRYLAMCARISSRWGAMNVLDKQRRRRCGQIPRPDQPRRKSDRARHARISENHRVLAAHRHGRRAGTRRGGAPSRSRQRCYSSSIARVRTSSPAPRRST